MATDEDILKLIKLVNMTYKHVSQLETLIDLIDNQDNFYNTEDGKEYLKWRIHRPVMAGELFSKVSVIAKTTRNSKYGFQFYKSPKLQDPENHINRYVDDDLKIIKSL